MVKVGQTWAGVEIWSAPCQNAPPSSQIGSTSPKPDRTRSNVAKHNAKSSSASSCVDCEQKRDITLLDSNMGPALVADQSYAMSTEVCRCHVLDTLRREVVDDAGATMLSGRRGQVVDRRVCVHAVSYKDCNTFTVGERACGIGAEHRHRSCGLR